MLDLHPNCELCDRDLPADSCDARICSYECTFCVDCVEQVLANVCPNCGGGFCKRPIRPKTAYRESTSIEYQAASTKRINSPYSKEQVIAFAESIKQIPVADR